jgi:hypothetical protein
VLVGRNRLVVFLAVVVEIADPAQRLEVVRIERQDMAAGVRSKAVIRRVKQRRAQADGASRFRIARSDKALPYGAD